MASAAAKTTAIRKRRPILRTTGLVVLGVIVIYGGFALYLATRPVVISLDAVQKAREALPKPAKPGDAAWPAYRDAMVAMGFSEGRLQNESVGDAMGDHPGDDGWSGVSAWLDANQAGLQKARAASSRPMFGFPLGGDRSPADDAFFGKVSTYSFNKGDWRDRADFPMLGLSLPQLGSLRGVARVLESDMFRAAEQGDGERATQDLQALMAMSIHVAEGRVLISDLVGMAIRRQAVTSLVAILEWKPAVFTDDQLRRMQTSLRSVPASLERLDLAMERLMFEDAVQRFFSDDGRGDGWFVPSWAQMRIVSVVEGTSANPGNRERAVPLAATAFVSVLRPIGSVMVAGRRETLAHYEAFTRELEAASVGSPRLVLEQVTPIDARQEVQSGDARQRTRYFLETLLVPALSRAAVNFAVDRASRDAACVAIAAELFHRANKRWPRSAAELAPFNGGQAPADPWADAPIRMAEDKNGFRMWSVGRDGQDDGGGDRRALDAGGATVTSTAANHGDLSGQPMDWVWFAPRGNLDRWKD